MAKGFRHRFSVSIYDKTPLDREIVDYIANLDNAHAKQEFLRSLIRAGFSAMVKNRNTQQAALDGIDPETLAVALQTLSTLSPASAPPTVIQQSAPQHAYTPQHDDRTNIEDKKKEVSKPSSSKKDKEQLEEPISSFKSQIKQNEENSIQPNIDPSTANNNYEDLSGRDLSETVDDDDIQDPMAMFSGEGGFL